ncbi:MAG: hypothetical protein V1870_04200 [Candidatus Aenigmatarchaeota archaeon]
MEMLEKLKLYEDVLKREITATKERLERGGGGFSPAYLEAHVRDYRAVLKIFYSIFPEIKPDEKYFLR